jgi:pimeloyl-ACP methyl ester carboxylesterase
MIERQKVRVHELELEVCMYTSSINSIPVVILHGFMDHHLAWDDVCKALTDKSLNVLSYDQRGHGRSSHVSSSSQYHFPDYISDLYELLEVLQITKCHLIGHSMGGTVASIFAAVFPKKVDKLFLIEGLGPSHENEDQSFKRLQRHFLQRTCRSEHKKYPVFEDLVKRIQKIYPYLSEEKSKCFASYLGKAVVDLDGVGKKSWTWCYDVRHKDAAAISFHALRHLMVLAHIKSPTYLLFGRTSWYNALPDLEKRIQKLSNCVEIQYLDCGHNPHLECPTQLSEWLIQKLSEEMI